MLKPMPSPPAWAFASSMAARSVQTPLPTTVSHWPSPWKASSPSPVLLTTNISGNDGCCAVLSPAERRQAAPSSRIIPITKRNGPRAFTAGRRCIVRPIGVFIGIPSSACCFTEVLQEFRRKVTAKIQRSEVRGQRSESREQRAESREQRAEGRGQRTEDRGQQSAIDSRTTIQNHQPST